ncbi:MAG: CAP domain-containing protein [Gaiellaceae bacterium]
MNGAKRAAAAGSIVVALALGAAGQVPAAGAASTTTREVPGLEAAIVRQVNAFRTRHGLARLHVSVRLAASAEDKSRRMAARGYFDHDSPSGAPFWRQIERFYGSRGYRYWSVGENIEWGPAGIAAETALEAWLRSPPHRAVLLRARYRQFGLSAVEVTDAPGVYGGQAVTIVTAHFGVRRR